MGRNDAARLAVRHPPSDAPNRRGYTISMTKPYTGVPGFNVDLRLDDPPPPSNPPPLQRSFVPKPNTTTVTLRGVSVPLNSDVGQAFVADCCRNRERIFSDARLQEKYSIDPSDWNDIVNNKALRLAISAECDRRMLNGDSAKESAAKIFTEAPEVLGSILRDNKASPRHRIEASKELRATAHSDDEKPGAEKDRVIVTINLGGDERLVVDCGPPKQSKEVIDAEKEW